MEFNCYQTQARKTALYPGVGSNPIYPTLGLSGEAGEVADKVKKVLRDHGGVFDDLIKESIELELGDVLWYVAQLSTELGLEMDEIANANLQKLSNRMKNKTISGDGDNR